MRQQSRRVFFLTFLVLSLATLIFLAWGLGPAYIAYWKYSPREGDIVFQSLPHSRLVDAIEGVTESPYSHCAIVAKQNGKWVVFEAFHNVEVTPLRTFIFRGRNLGFAVYRLKSEYQKHAANTIENVKTYLGRPMTLATKWTTIAYTVVS